MSYIKNCNKCGKTISMREMTHGQWVAFELNSDVVHKHGKGSKTTRTTNSSSHQTSSSKRPTEAHNQGSSDSSSGWGPWIIIGVIGFIVYILFSA